MLIVYCINVTNQQFVHLKFAQWYISVSQQQQKIITGKEITENKYTYTHKVS